MLISLVILVFGIQDLYMTKYTMKCEISAIYSIPLSCMASDQRLTSANFYSPLGPSPDRMLRLLNQIYDPSHDTSPEPENKETRSMDARVKGSNIA